MRKGKLASDAIWEETPTERIERSDRVKGRQGRDLGVKKGLREEKLHFWRSTPVQPVSAMRGVGEEGRGATMVDGV